MASVYFTASELVTIRNNANKALDAYSDANIDKIYESFKKYPLQVTGPTQVQMFMSFVSELKNVSKAGEISNSSVGARARALFTEVSNHSARAAQTLQSQNPGFTIKSDRISSIKAMCDCLYNRSLSSTFGATWDKAFTGGLNELNINNSAYWAGLPMTTPLTQAYVGAFGSPNTNDSMGGNSMDALSFAYQQAYKITLQTYSRLSGLASNMYYFNETPKTGYPNFGLFWFRQN